MVAGGITVETLQAAQDKLWQQNGDDITRVMFPEGSRNNTMALLQVVSLKLK